MSITARSIDTQLGLTQSELVILRQEREIVAAQGARDSQSQSRSERSTMAESRGRGTGRASQASSTRATSTVSSSAARVANLDPTSLNRIHNALESFMHNMQRRIQQLEEATDETVIARCLAAAGTSAAADAEVRKIKKVIRDLDALDKAYEETMELFIHIAKLRKRAEAINTRMNMISTQQVSVRPDPRRR